MIETGVRFTNLHSFRDLDLILSPFTPSPAPVKTTYIDVPGADGSLDLTEANGEIKYGNRTFQIKFTVNPESEMTFDEKVSQVSNALNGRERQIIFDRDSEYYWWGRLTVNEYLQDKNIKQLTVTANVEPYKYKIKETQKTFTLSPEETTIILKNGRKSVVPYIECTDDNTSVTFGGTGIIEEHILSAGTHRFLDCILREGENYVWISGTGEITFRYREGDL